MKKLLMFLLLSTAIMACQKKQYFSSAPEIDLIKKGNEAYFKGDWESLRSLYADTANIYDNTWLDNEITADQYIENMKAGLTDFTEYKLADEREFIEMVETDDGQRWVHDWLLWGGTHKSGKKVLTTVHIASQVINNKIVNQVFMYDRLASYLAAQPDSTVNP